MGFPMKENLGDPSGVAAIPGFGPGDYHYGSLLRTLPGVSVVTITGEGGFGASNACPHHSNLDFCSIFHREVLLKLQLFKKNGDAVLHMGDESFHSHLI